MTIFAPSLGAIWEQLESYGLDPAPLFREFDIAPGTVFDTGARVSSEKVQRLDVEAVKRTGDPLFVLKGADYFRPPHLGALGFAWLASNDLRTAFARLKRYVRVVQSDLAIDFEEAGGLFHVRLYSDAPDFYADLSEDSLQSSVLKLCRLVAGDDFNPVRVRFRKDPPADAAYYFELFRCAIDFNAEDTEFVIRQADVDRRLTGANEELANLNEHIVVKYLAHHDRKDIVNQVKASIIHGLASGTVSEQTVADAIHTTPRNLHRKLSNENTTFKQLLNEIRQDLARQYIQDRSKTLTEIAFLLGFSEVSSFSRAYKSWTGVPPSQSRKNPA